jgi:geranylgeranyl reductase family protein
VIIGGGPAGLYAAGRLARFGLSVRVVEEHPVVGEPVHCTGILSADAFELPGVPRDAVLRREATARLHSPSGHEWRIAAPREEIFVVDRGAFDRGLAARAAAAGALVDTGTRARYLAAGDRGVEVRLEGEAGARRLAAQVCVIATGARYGFQRRLGWGIPPLVLCSAQTEVPAAPGAGFDLFFRDDTAPEGFAWMAPVRRGGAARAKVGVMVRGRARGVLDRVLADLRSQGRIGAAPAPSVVRPLPLSPLTRTYGRRVLAVGDAAGLVKPTTGGGIYYSLLSAGWAADVVLRAFERGDFSAASLSEYEATWREQLGRELRIGVWARRLAARLTSGDLDRLVDLAIHDGIAPVLRRSGRFNWHAALILELLRHPGVLTILAQRLFAHHRMPAVALG